MLKVFAEEGNCPDAGGWEDLSTGQRGREHLGLPETALLPPSPPRVVLVVSRPGKWSWLEQDGTG